MILTGLSGIIIVEIYTSVMQMEFQNTHNRVGKGFAILGIYLFVVTYCESPLHLYDSLTPDTLLTLDGMLNSTTWLYGSEVLPIALRSKVMGTYSVHLVILLISLLLLFVSVLFRYNNFMYTVETRSVFLDFSEHSNCRILLLTIPPVTHSGLAAASHFIVNVASTSSFHPTCF